MTVAYGGVHDSKTQMKEHVEVGDVGAKRVLMSGYDGVNLNDINIDSNGNLSIINGLSIPEHDEIVLSYTGSNLTGVVYKLATVVVATLTLSYDGSDNLIGVVKS